MVDENEIVVIEIVTADRIMLSEQIMAQMTSLGYPAFDYPRLNLGFDLGPTWPADIESELTLTQLIVLAKKLDMRIVINGLIVVPRYRQADQKTTETEKGK